MYLATGHYLWGAMADEKYTVEVVNRVDDAEVKAATANVKNMTDSLKAMMAAMSELTRESKSGGPSALSKWGLSADQAKTMKDTTGAMKSASDAVTSFGRATKSMEGIDNIGEAAKRNAKVMTDWRNSISGIKGLTERELSKLSTISQAMNSSADAVAKLTKAYQEQVAAKRALFAIDSKTKNAEAKLALDARKQGEVERSNRAKESLAAEKTASAERIAALRSEQANADSIRKADVQTQKSHQAEIQADKRQTTAIAVEEIKKETAAQRTKAAEVTAASRTEVALTKERMQTAAIAYQQEKQARRDSIALARANEQAIIQEIRSLESARFAARELAQMNTVAGTALMAGPVMAIKSFADQERAFADVRRTSQEASISQLDLLSSKYMKLSTEIPIAYQELSRIGTLGAQMDIPTEELEDFTEAVGTFSTITGESADSSAMAFGRISAMLGGLKESTTGAGDQYMLLASQVSEVGAKLVATEAEILNTTVSIASFAHDAGFAQDEVIGLAGALSSLRITPEWSRGAIQRIFMKFNEAVAEGGEALDTYARQLGISGQAAESLWRNNPQEFFMQLLVSLNEVGDGIARTQALSELGFTNTRDVNALIRMSGAINLVEKSFREAEDAGKDTSFATQAMEIVSQTLTETANRLKNALANTFSSFGAEGSETLKFMAEALIKVLNLITQLPGWMKAFVMAGLTLSAVVVLIKAAQYALFALSGSLINAQKRMIDLGTNGQMTWGNLVRSIGSANVALAQYNALMSTKRTNTLFDVPTVAATAKLADNFRDAAGAATQLGIKAAGATTVVATAGRSLMGLFGGLPGVIAMVSLTAIPPLISAISSIGTKAQAEARAAEEAARRLGTAMGDTQTIIDAITTDSLAAQSQVAIDGVKGLSAAMEVAGSSTGNATSATSFYVSAQGELINTTARAAAEQGLFNLELGKSYEKLVMNALVSGDYMDGLTQAQLEGLTALGFSVSEFASISAQSAEEGEAYLNSMKDKAAAHYREVREELAKVKTEAGYIQGMYGTSAPTDMDAKTRERIKALDAEAVAARETAAAMGVFGDSLVAVDGVAQIAIAQHQVMGFELDEVEESAEGAASSLDNFKSELEDLISTSFSMNDATIAIDKALEDLGAKLAESGNYIGPDSPSGRASLQAIQGLFQAFGQEAQAGVETLGWTTEEAQAHVAARIQETINWLGQQGIDTTYVVDAANQIISAMGFTVSPGIDTNGFVAGLNSMKVAAFDTAQYVAALLASMNAAVGRAPTRGESAWGARYAAQGAAKASGARNTTGYGGAGSTWAPSAPSASSGVSSAGSFKPLDFSSAKPSSSGGGGGGGKGGGGGGGGGGGAGKAAQSAADQFEDFMKRLSSAMKDAMDNFWATSVAQDSYHKSLNSLRDNVAKTTEKIDDLTEANRKLKTEMLEDQQALRDATFFNEIAKKYGDTERTASTQTDMDKASADIAEKQALIAANEKEARTLRDGQFALTGYSDAAIQNRAALRDLQTQMVGLIEDYAKSGASTQQIQAYTAKLKQEFIAQATQLGFNRTEVVKLAGGFDSLRATIGTVPRTVAVKTTDNGTTAGVQRGINALSGKNIGIGTYAANPNTPIDDVANAAARRKISLNFVGGYLYSTSGTMIGSLRNQGGPIGFAGGGQVPGKPPANPNADNVLAKSNGGLYGLRSGEWVISQPAVDYYGKGVMEAINSRSLPVASSPSRTSQGPVIARLTAGDLVAMARAVSTMLVVDNQVVAKTANAANVGAGNRGVY